MEGAKEGLEKKLRYFKSKDYDISFGVLVGQACNLASQDVVHKNSTLYQKFDFWFDFLLEQRQRKDNIEKFEMYWDTIHPEPIAFETPKDMKAVKRISDANSEIPF